MTDINDWLRANNNQNLLIIDTGYCFCLVISLDIKSKYQNRNVTKILNP